MLETERKYYEETLEQLLADHPDMFVVIKGRELIGVHNTIEEALSEGARRFGMKPFLVRQVTKTQGVVNIPALTLGILNAHSSNPV